MTKLLAKLFRGWADRLDPATAFDREAICKELEQTIRLNVVRQPKPEFALPKVTPDWTPECAGAFRSFLSTIPGRTLTDRLLTVVAANAINGSRNIVNTVHAAGVSAGWDEAIRYLHSLSRVSRVTETTDEALTGEPGILEHLSP